MVTDNAVGSSMTKDRQCATTLARLELHVIYYNTDMVFKYTLGNEPSSLALAVALLRRSVWVGVNKNL